MRLLIRERSGEHVERSDPEPLVQDPEPYSAISHIEIRSQEAVYLLRARLRDATEYVLVANSCLPAHRQ